MVRVAWKNFGGKENQMMELGRCQDASWEFAGKKKQIINFPAELKVWKGLNMYTEPERMYFIYLKF